MSQDGECDETWMGSTKPRWVNTWVILEPPWFFHPPFVSKGFTFELKPYDLLEKQLWGIMVVVLPIQVLKIFMRMITSS